MSPLRRTTCSVAEIVVREEVVVVGRLYKYFYPSKPQLAMNPNQNPCQPYQPSLPTRDKLSSYMHCLCRVWYFRGRRIKPSSAHGSNQLPLSFRLGVDHKTL